MRKAQKVSKVDLRRQITANDLFALRTKLRTKIFRDSDELGRPKTKRSRHSYPRLPGRFSPGKSRPSHITRPYSSCVRTTEVPRLDDKHRKIDPHPKEGHRIFGRCMGSLAEHKISARQTIAQNTTSSGGPAKKRKYNARRGASSSGSDEFREFRDTEGSVELSSPTGLVQQNTKAANGRKSPTFQGVKAGAGMVEGSLRDSLTDTFSATDALPDDRCQRYRLGCEFGWSELRRSMVTEPRTLALQPKGTVSGYQRLKKSGSAPELRVSSNTVRQSHCGVLSSKRGRDEIECPNKTCEESSSNTRQIPHTYDHSLHSWQLQLRRRPSIPQAAVARVASSTRTDSEGIQQMGRASCRSICITPSSCGTGILHTRQERCQRDVLRRLQPDMEFSTGLDFSPTSSHPEGSDAIKQRHGHVPHSSSTLDEHILEARSQEPGACGSVYNREPRESSNRHDNGSSSTQGGRDDNRNLEMWGWNKKLSNWTAEQRTLLETSWRQSTLNTYRSAWNRWTAWAKAEGVNVTTPTGSDLARFLADLHQKEKLSLGTILVHKSVVSTFCSPDCQEKLSSHCIVKQIIKAITLAKPKHNKPPIWDTEHLTRFISSKNPDNLELFEVCKCTAAILLLCSGRRVHDLTLLRISSEHYYATDDYIVMKPVFGSKTDSCNFKQSDWKLIANKDNKALCPVHWVRRMILLSERRRHLAKSDSLFVSLTGPPKAATRAMIGGWVKKLLQEAGINATPGSVRSAVASKSWVENFQIDEIMSRANWRSSNTFTKFYRREIATVPTGVLSITRLFTPVND